MMKVMTQLRSGTAVFRTDAQSRIREWNPACEQLTGISAADAEGRSCWDVIAGQDAAGGIVCHPGCSVARLARKGWPVRCTDLQMRTPLGRRRLTISTIVLCDGHDTTVLHPVRETSEPRARAVTVQRESGLTRRQRQILSLLAEGVRVKEIAARLTLCDSTVRNHVHAILAELGAHSQLEAVARARALSLLGDELDQPEQHI
jgi:DNA-binding CsgD family transcriptional regulator